MLWLQLSHKLGDGLFHIDKADPFLCTHLIYTFAGLDINGHIISLDSDNDIRDRNYYKALELREQNPCLKVLIAIGGWNEGSEKYSVLAETEESRRNFADNALKFLVFYGFDGIDIDWEYPGLRGGIKEDKENFVKLVRTLKARLTKRNKMVTAALGATSAYIRASYAPMRELCDALDLVLIMSYDFHEVNRTSINAPLHREKNQNPFTETIAENIDLMIAQGCRPDKMVMGIPMYGRTYTLRDAKNHGVDALVEGLGEPGPFTVSHGSLGFNEICLVLSHGNFTVKYLKKNASKIAYSGKQWIAYDDPETVYQKTMFAMEKGLGGVMFWTIDTDDFRGNCYNMSYPLINTSKKLINDYTKSRS
ncbi:CLUMA_CG012917, isoform A [Clunio marinus]|uniref:CLUMA_CG012917, isoform A n=1 Tax=Clunio marinus TaxID=568069 RepID=A0A1J1IH80_9DIPT|nr:CLUMA_CG012917, isoform A [Clunio marinus]